MQICPGLNANEIQIPYDNHHKVSILDISAKMVNIVNLPLASTRCSPSSNGSGSTPVK